MMTLKRLKQIEDRIGILGTSGIDVPAGSISAAELDGTYPAASVGSADLDGTYPTGSIGATEISNDILNGAHSAEAVNVSAVGAMALVHRITLASGADADVDITLSEKSRVIDAWAVLSGAGTTGSIITVKNGANAISDVIDVAAGADTDVFRVAEIDNSEHDIATAGTLRISYASTSADFPGAEVYVMVLKVA